MALELYNEVVDNYASFMEISPEEAEKAFPEWVKRGSYDYFYKGAIFEGISETYYDLNNDGVEELLIALRSNSGGYALIDSFTIVDGEVISLFTDKMSASAMYKRSGLPFRNGNLVYRTASESGVKHGLIYELKEEELAYVETTEVSSEEGDYEIIEKELENELDINTLDWKSIGKEKESTVYDGFMHADFAAIEYK